MAAPEAVGATVVIKWLANVLSVVAIGAFGWLTTRLLRVENKVDDQYSKSETQEQIELRMQPYKTAVENNTEAVNRLSEILVDIKVDAAEVKTDVKNIKEDRNKRG